MRLTSFRSSRISIFSSATSTSTVRNLSSSPSILPPIHVTMPIPVPMIVTTSPTIATTVRMECLLS